MTEITGSWMVNPVVIRWRPHHPFFSCRVPSPLTEFAALPLPCAWWLWIEQRAERRWGKHRSHRLVWGNGRELL